MTKDRLRRAILNAAKMARMTPQYKTAALWVIVRDTLGYGDTQSQQTFLDVGLNPDATL